MPSDYFLHVNTLIDRRSVDTDTTDVTVYLSKPFVTNGKVKLQMTNIELPNLAYTFPYHSCVLWYILDPLGANTLQSVTIRTDRNYNNANDLVTDLNTAVNANLLVFSYDNNTCRLTLTNNNPATIKLVSSYRYSENTNCYNDCMDRLGFDQDLRTTNLMMGDTLEANSCLKLLRSNCYYITCDQVGSYLQQSTPVGLNKPNILARVTANNFGYLSQLSFVNQMVIDTPENMLDKLQFKILDSELYPISLNNASITFTIRLTID